MSEMVERVARAIAADWNVDPDALVAATVPEFLSHPRLGVYGAYLKAADDSYMPAWRLFLSMARAAIRAMREPTSDMSALASESTDSLSQYSAMTVWQIMIDEALK
jgi:hypothetical protein